MRASGVLLPISALPGKYGIGCFSKEAYEFIDVLEKSEQTYWQILPIGPTGYGDSPYQSFSVFAGNPYFISLEELIKQGVLTEAECNYCSTEFSEDSINYEQLYRVRFQLLRKAYERSDIEENDDFKQFRIENEYWLKDYAMFMALKDYFGGISFNEWDEDVKLRKAESMNRYCEMLRLDIGFYEYIQFEFYRQWFRLKRYANDKGIEIIGDIPIYVAYDSADVWSHPELFQIRENMELEAVAGCPPDGFCAKGQLWGNPLYRWEYHKKTEFEWWVQRMAKSNQLYDVIRIDHFRGFDEYYSIPASHETAEFGCWESGPGIDLFYTIKKSLGDVPIIAEDLGFITDSVKKLVKDTGFPNMKVLEFAFDSRDSSGTNEYLPHNYDKNCVVYTGTHDNETLFGWLNNIGPEELALIEEYIGKNIAEKEGYVDEMIRLAQASCANMCIIPLQDYLCLGNEARMNMPSTLGNNWKWRYQKGDLDESVINKIKKYTGLYGRARI